MHMCTNMYKQGTQRSITKAQDLIDEALSTPDNTLDFTVPSPTPSPDGGSSITTSNTTTTTFSDSPLASVTVTTNHSKKKYSDIIPSKTPPTTTTVFEASRYIPTETVTSRYNSCVPSTDDMKSVPAKEKGSHQASNVSPRTTASSSSARSKAWLIETGVSSFASVAAGGSPHHGTTTTMGQRSPILAALQDDLSQSVSDSEEERDREVRSSSSQRWQRQTPSGVVSITPEPSTAGGELDVNMSSEFPPLGKHSRSKSDPQVSSADQQDELDSETSQTSECYTQSLTSSVAQNTSLSSSLDLPPNTPPNDGHPRESRSASGPEKLPSYSTGTPEKGVSAGTRYSAPVVSTIESPRGVSSTLAVGGDVSKTTKSVAVIQPTKVCDPYALTKLQILHVRKKLMSKPSARWLNF